MILEVNNTFDERRIYFLKGSAAEHGVSGDKNENSQSDSQGQGSPVESIPGRFATSWPKDFHVSPFNSRKGAYSLSASDPFFPHLSSKAGVAFVNNTITLSSSKQHPKLIARIFSSSDSIDPYKLTGWGTFKFIAAWWWVGFFTFPRIVREAGKLFFRRKLHVWYRPEVLKDSIGRNETEDEKYCFWDPSVSQLLIICQSYRLHFPTSSQNRCRKLRSSILLAISTGHRSYVRRRILHAARLTLQDRHRARPCDFQDHFPSLLRPNRPLHISLGVRQARSLRARSWNSHLPYVSP